LNILMQKTWTSFNLSHNSKWIKKIKKIIQAKNLIKTLIRKTAIYMVFLFLHYILIIWQEKNWIEKIISIVFQKQLKILFNVVNFKRISAKEENFLRTNPQKVNINNQNLHMTLSFFVIHSQICILRLKIIKGS
jgi:hypothetical protein